MRTLLPIGSALALLLTACGLESFAYNASHKAYDRPASAFTGAAAWTGATGSQLSVLDGAGNALASPEPMFSATAGGGTYRVKLKSAQYTFLRVSARAGDMTFRHIVPQIGEETTLTGIDLDARAVTEAMIVEANLAARGLAFSRLSPAAYLGAQAQIRADLDGAGPTHDLLGYVERLIAVANPTTASIDPDLFTIPAVTRDPTSGVWTVTASPINASFLARNLVDYTGDGTRDLTTAAFDAALVAAAQKYKPEGCPDPTKVRLVFTVDFREGHLSGNCGPINRFLWTVDKPGKQMFFVGWIHKESEVQDPAVNTLLGASVPNQVAMYDDGTNGDAVAGDGVWTKTFDLPVDPGGKKLRIGYKYTWGLRGQVWTGSEEWPGNSRIIQVDQVAVDAAGKPLHEGIVYRFDTYGDEATNKDNSNLNVKGHGTITWDTDLHACGVPEARETKFDNDACACLPWRPAPPTVSTINVACSGP